MITVVLAALGIVALAVMLLGIVEILALLLLSGMRAPSKSPVAWVKRWPIAAVAISAGLALALWLAAGREGLVLLVNLIQWVMSV